MEVTSLMYIINIFTYFVSGQMFPLELLAGYPYVTQVLNLLPFQYMAYFPAVVFLGKIQGPELARGLLAEAAWALGLMLLARWLYHRGLRRYSACGG